MTEKFKLWLYKNYPDKFIDIDLTLLYKLFKTKLKHDFIKSKIEEGERSGFVDSLETKLNVEENDG